MKRSEFIKAVGILGLGLTGLNSWLKAAGELGEDDHWQPALFVGHGSPMNILADNSYTKALQAAGLNLPRPKAVLVISAHWLTRGTFITATASPSTIHDFYGFSDALYAEKYPAQGTPGGAKMTKRMLHRADAQLDLRRGLDHGAWSVLKHMYPEADVPVFQLSIDRSKPLDYLYRLAALIRDLRKKGVLVIGSGNITHNLSKTAREEDAPVEDWAADFDAKVANLVQRRDHQAIIDYEKWGKIAKVAHPSNDHFLPLIYSLGISREEEEVKFIHEGFQHGTISMRCIQFG